MSEFEHRNGGSSASGRPQETGPIASVKSAVEGAAQSVGAAAQTARETIGEAADTAIERVDGARRKASDLYARTADWAGDTAETAARNATYARRRANVHLGRGRSNLERLVDENPIMIGVVGLAAGLLAGALLPGTRKENQVFGRYADEVKDQGYRYARDLAEQGRHFVEENIQAASQAARDDTPPRDQQGGSPRPA